MLEVSDVTKLKFETIFLGKKLGRHLIWELTDSSAFTKKMRSIAALLLLCALSVGLVSSFQFVCHRIKLQKFAPMSMMFGGAKKTAAKITITVDGKMIECAGPINLRKELMANKIDVYPLKAKLLGVMAQL